jgi:type VI secretion system secreted protein VgrG
MSDGPTIDYKQEGRLLQITTTLEDNTLLLEKFSGAETLSKPFEFHVTLLSTDFDIDLKSLLRTSATVALVLVDGTKRYFNTVIHSIMQGQEDSDVEGGNDMGIGHPAHELATYEAILVPKLWFLSLNSDCKIFQNMSVPDIVAKVLDDAGISDYQFQTYGTYPTREYCVQYRESSLTFISRLLEEEGIFYFFAHRETKHTIIFIDKNTTGGAVPGQEIVKYSFDQEGWVAEGEEGIAMLERIETVYTGKAALTDYNFETPNVSLLDTLGSVNEEAFDYPGEYTTKDDGSRYSRIRLEERESVQFVLNGASRCRAFRPGYYFTLKDHYRKDTNGDYFLTSVTHEAVDSTYRNDTGVSEYYTNVFTAIPKSVAYRPPRETPRPTVKGLQPALVVGKAGEEIWVDKYGRVKVQFYWDRQGQKNENSSCWVRVAQIWAGKNWGWMTIPRIGQEVLVDFLEGDPDRPIIVGRVYNADQMPPWTLPDNQTQSGILTRSSKGGTAENANYIQFEDKTDGEQINVWAQKDMNTTVENNDTQTVKVDRTIEVDGKHTEKIVGDTTITITTGNHSTTVQTGNQSIDIDTGNQTTTIKTGNQSTTLNMGNQSTQLDLGNIKMNCDVGSISLEAMTSITLTVGGNSITIDQSGITVEGMMITISGDTMTTVEGDAMLTLTGGITMINS